jgi:CspA family cold shock protein
MNDQLFFEGMEDIKSKTMGTVKWFNDAKGFGFLNCPGQNDVFIHYTQILGDGFKTVSEGQNVAFDLEINDKGAAIAKNVLKGE